MSDKKTNEILEEQKRARQEFLNLKKMQQGEMYAGPKPSETATALKNPKDKFKNFWYYSKGFIIAGIVLAVAIAVMVVQCAKRPNYDLKLVYFTYNSVLDDQIAPISDYLEKYCDDINGDGETNIQVINCSISTKTNSTQIGNAVYQKLQTIIMVEESAMLFITDEDSIKYFDNFEDGVGAIFHENSAELGDDFYNHTKHKDFGTLPKGLTLHCRNISEETLKEKEETASYFNSAQNIINGVKN